MLRVFARIAVRGLAWSGCLLLLTIEARAADKAKPADKAKDAPPVVFEAGAASVEVTPPVGLPMWGYGSRRDNPNEGVMDPLYADALVLAVGDSRLALVGLDLGRAPTRTSMAKIRARIKEEAGVEHCFIVGSHTHHGPIMELDDIPSAENPYTRKLENLISDAIIAANKARRPAKMGVGTRNVNLNRNRHSKLEPKPRDPMLAVIRVDDLEGKSIATVVNLAAHPTMIDDKVMLWSADFPGSLKATVRKELGGECLFLQGAAGDMSANSPPGVHGHVAFGAAVGREAISLARSIETAVPANPSIVVREEDFRFPNMRIDLNNGVIKAVYIRAFFKRLVDFFVEEYKDGVRPHLTVALVNGEIGLVGASGEFFSNHSVRLKERSRLPYTLFFGYCNDYQQYFPTIEGAAEGGYGADPAVSPVPIGAGEEIMNRALFHLYDMQGKYQFKLF